MGRIEEEARWKEKKLEEDRKREELEEQKREWEENENKFNELFSIQIHSAPYR